MKNFMFLVLPLLLSGCNMTAKELEDFTKSMNQITNSLNKYNDSDSTSYSDHSHQNFMFQEQNRLFQEQVNRDVVQHQIIQQHHHQPF